MICINIVFDTKADLSLGSANKDEDKPVGGEHAIAVDTEALSDAEPSL